MSDPVVLLSLPEVAERLRVSRRTVEREIDAGHLRAVRIGRRVLVTERELRVYVGHLERRGRVA